MTTDYSLDQRAVIWLPGDLLDRLLDLPDGVEVHHIFGDPVRNAIGLVVRGPSLASVPDGEMAPEFPEAGAMLREECSVAQPDGTTKAYVRFGWEPTT